MFAFPSRTVDRPAAAANGMARRHLLSDWDIGELVDMKYSYGLTGVDQRGNYLWVDTFLYLLLAIGVGLLILRISNMFWRHQRHLTVMANPSNQKYWMTNKTTWWPWLNRHLLAAPLWNKRHNCPAVGTPSCSSATSV
jgi:hypothetical protein